MNGLGTVILGFGSIAGLIAVAVIGAQQEQEKWERFSAQHQCVKVSQERGGTAISTSGKAVFLPNKTGYKCNDGITYIREH